ncbi:MAG: hypothetical protein ABI629_21920 [bacterium]
MRPIGARAAAPRDGYWLDANRLCSGSGEVMALNGDERNRAGYVRLRDRFDVITRADCYRRADVQVERERRFRPEHAEAGEARPI